MLRSKILLLCILAVVYAADHPPDHNVGKDCNLELAPVCGVDDLTYGNACFATHQVSRYDSTAPPEQQYHREI